MVGGKWLLGGLVIGGDGGGDFVGVDVASGGKELLDELDIGCGRGHELDGGLDVSSDNASGSTTSEDGGGDKGEMYCWYGWI